MNNQENQNPQAPVAAQPVNQQPQPGQPVQYVVMQDSLDGIGGWLLFFMIMFVLSGIGYITAFFAGLEAGAEGASEVTLMIFSPIIAVTSIAAVVLMALRKKLGQQMALLAIAASSIYSVIAIIIANNESRNPSFAVTLGSILAGLVVAGLFAMYFVISKRVKQTLVK